MKTSNWWATNLLQPGTDLLSKDYLEGKLLHAHNVDGRELAARHGDDELHADEGRANDHQTLALLDGCEAQPW